MKKLVNKRMLYRVNGGEWRETSIYNKIRYIDVDAQDMGEYWKSRPITFDETVELIKKGFIINASLDTTWFGKKTVVVLPDTSLERLEYRYTKEKLQTVEIKEVYEPFSCTMKTLMNLLPADEFCEYLKDRKISTCPMLDK